MDLFISLLIALFGLSNEKATEIGKYLNSKGDGVIEIETKKLQDKEYRRDLVTYLPML